jgi:hypothetical protein
VALFGGETSGEIALDGIPDDIVERLERRVSEERWLGVDSGSKYRVCERDEPPGGYRQGPKRATSIRVQLDTPARLGAMLEDAELDFTDARRVRYHVRYPRAYKGSFVLGGAIGGFFGLIAIATATLVGEMGAFLGIIAAILFVFLTYMGLADTEQRARQTIQKILREEIAASRNEARLADRFGGGRGATAQAILSVLTARGIELTDAERAHVLATTDRDVLDEWLKKAATATRIADVLGKTRVALEEEEEEDEPVSARARRGSG